MDCWWIRGFKSVMYLEFSRWIWHSGELLEIIASSQQGIHVKPVCIYSTNAQHKKLHCPLSWITQPILSNNLMCLRGWLIGENLDGLSISSVVWWKYSLQWSSSSQKNFGWNLTHCFLFKFFWSTLERVEGETEDSGILRYFYWIVLPLKVCQPNGLMRNVTGCGVW